ncbi:DUF853 family protein [Conchiformibius steedae]|uniref:DUF853 family protein n=2 Tax=Conchiformibius steedae TaxID=153493 RepID=A0A3P2A3I4_9NEIS|nr:DUF853 family protein [Conchiformibius steedae]
MIGMHTLAYNEKFDTFQIIGNMANRHGLIAGATGTGKTVTLRKMVEVFSSQGIPVFLADVKGDLSGLVKAGTAEGKIGSRLDELGLNAEYFSGFPVRFWDVYGQTGIPVRVSMEQMGVLLLARLMNLNDAQEGVLNLVFRVAQDKNWRLIDIADLRSMLNYVSQNRHQYQTIYGNVSTSTIGAIQRQLLQLESEQAEKFFGLPKLDLHDWLQQRKQQGIINILNADKLIYSPRLYSAFMLWFLEELFRMMPEKGDGGLPEFVMFFDEAHLMFDDGHPALMRKIEQMVRLIRSKGVGIYFITQSPADIPESVLGQLNNRVQHALRAYTPREQKAVRTAAETFRPNPHLNAVQAISELAVGEALVSFLDKDGIPGMVQRTWIMPPRSRLLPLNDTELQEYVQADPLYIRYRDSEKVFSAYDEIELLAQQQIDEDNHDVTIGNTDFITHITVTPTISLKSVECQHLTKGQNALIPLNGSARLLVRLGWQAPANTVLDISVFMLDKQKKVISDNHMIFYNQTASPCGSVILHPDGRRQSDINLSAVPESVHTLLFAVTADTAGTTNHVEFGAVNHAFISIYDEQGINELMRFDLPDDVHQETAMIFGEIYRYQNDWKFRAVAQGYAGGLDSLCKQYGLLVS